QFALFKIQSKAGDITRISPVYKSVAWGFEADDFLNMCIAIETQLNPKQLLANILEIEREMGRIRIQEQGYEPRIIDIDIIYFEKQIILLDDLVVPHPEMAQRRFVLKPLADIAPQFYHPIYKKDTRNLLQECKDKGAIQKTGFRFFKDRQQLFAHQGFIAIEGNIGAGKTTLANRIAVDFNAKAVLERFADNPFLPKFYEDQSRYAFPLEMSFLADRYQQFTDDTSQYDLFKSFMVSDYDIYKSLIFAQITLQKEEFGLYRKLFDLMYREVKKPRIYIYLYQNTARLMDNIKKRGRDYEQNISREYLERINQGYLDFLRSHPDQNSIILDLSEMDFVESHEDYESLLVQIQDFAIGLAV
ncbi:MAG: 2-amino-4-hydroxy-6-hydroxymethyldihydropteridine diphosphokinase, partial [Flavobacteriales bacterium]